MPTELTFTSLQEDLRRYLERGNVDDPTVYEQLPRLINNAERRIATELKVLGFIVPVTDSWVKGQAVYPKPDRWREVVSVNYGKSDLYATSTRESAAGVRTLGFQEPHPFQIGETVLVDGVGGVGYDNADTGVVVTAISQLTITYAQGANTEALTADTGGLVSLVPNKREPLFPRSYEYCRQFWPDDSEEGDPQFYADYNYDHYIVVPTPRFAFPFEYNYYELPALLDDINQTNWVTEYAPNLLLYASLLEATPFLKNDDRIPTWQQMYERAASGISQQDTARMQDRASQRNKA